MGGGQCYPNKIRILLGRKTKEMDVGKVTMFSIDIFSSIYNSSYRKYIERFTSAKNICQLT